MFRTIRGVKARLAIRRRRGGELSERPVKKSQRHPELNAESFDALRAGTDSADVLLSVRNRHHTLLEDNPSSG
jgi:hypothetical protein